MKQIVPRFSGLGCGIEDGQESKARLISRAVLIQVHTFFTLS